MTKVGDTIWVFGKYRRAIYRENWVPHVIASETTRSWVIGPNWNKRKIPKKGADPRTVAFSLADVEKDCWMYENQYRLSQHVQRIKDYDILQRVAEITNFVEDIP